jgi:hypothetical protein
MTTTLCHTSSREADNALRIARVAAAGRVQAAREARTAAADTYAAQVVTSLRAEGAVTVGFKVVNDFGKFRRVLPIDEAAWFVAATYGDEAEVWGINAAGEHTGGDVW